MIIGVSFCLWMVLFCLCCHVTHVQTECSHEPVATSYCAIGEGLGENPNVSVYGFDKTNIYCFRKTVYYSNGTIYTTKGTASPQMCADNFPNSSLQNPNCNASQPQGGTVCFDCCANTGCTGLQCNDYDPMNLLDPKYYLPSTIAMTSTVAMTTTVATTTTTVPTTTTTVTTTTASTLSLTTTATMTASRSTTKPVTTASPHLLVHKCQVCTDGPDSHCHFDDIASCGQHETMCMNVISQERGQLRVEKRCATEMECYWRNKSSASDPRCQLGTANFTGHVCSYCCRDKGGSLLPCNANKFPPMFDFSHLHPPAPKCQQGTPNFGSITENQCNGDKPFCLNEILYSDSASPQVVKRGCVPYSKCLDSWWKRSRLDKRCHETNSSVGSYSCDFCCLSNSSGSCNEQNRPTDLFEYHPETIYLPDLPTTIDISTTSTASTSMPSTSSALLSTTTTTTTASTVITTLPKTQPLMTTTSVKPAPATRSCHVCGDESQHLACSAYQTHTDVSIASCPSGHAYCMTTITADGTGNPPSVYKSCVDRTTCDRKWLQLTSDLSYCKNFDQSNLPSVFTCHFCCTTNNCNSHFEPDKNHLFVGR